MTTATSTGVPGCQPRSTGRSGHDRALNALEREFLSQSRAASERQLERQRHTNRRLRGLLVGTAVLLVAALVAGLFALFSATTPSVQALKSDAERVGTLAQTENNLDLSMLLASAGVKLDNIPETRGDLLEALQRNPAVIHIIRPSSSEITAVVDQPRRAVHGHGRRPRSRALREPEELETKRRCRPAAGACPPSCSSFLAGRA